MWILNAPSAPVQKCLPHCYYVRSFRLLFSSAEKWEELGRNLGGTWEEQSACADGLFWETVPVSDFQGQSYSFFSHRQRFVLKVCCFCPEYWFFRDDTDYWMWRETNRMQRCFYVFEIWDNWDKLDKWGDNWDLR